MLGLSRWTPKRLLATWTGYWVALGLATIGPIIIRTMGVALPGDAKGSVSVGYANGEFTVSVVNAGATVWASVTSFSTIAFWIAVPPLVLWALWMFSRPRRPTVDNPASVPPGELGAGRADFHARAREPDHAPERRDRP